MQAVLVKWVDSTGDGHWQDMDVAKLAQPHEVTTLGFLLDDSETHITIIQSFSDVQRSIDNLICIPKVAVVNVRKVRLP